MKDNPLFAVIGLGKFGSAIAKTLAEAKKDVIAIDEDEDRVEEISAIVTHAVQLNATNGQSLKEIGIEDVDVAIVSVGEDLAASIMICSYLKNDLKIKKVIAKASDNKHANVLKKLSVDMIVHPERESAERLVEKLISPNIFDIIEISDNFSIVEILSPDVFADKSIAEIDLRRRHNVNLIAIKRKNPILNENEQSDFLEETIINPPSAEVIIKGDILVLVGDNQSIENVKKI